MAKKKQAAKRTSSKKKKKQTGAPFPYTGMCAILLFFSALFGVFIYTQSSAVVAGFFHDLFFGLFAKTAWFVPVVLLGLCIYTGKSRSCDRLGIKSALCFFLLVFVAALVHMLHGETLPFAELYSYGTNGVGGGFLGGAIAKLLIGSIGKIASVLVALFAIVILLSVIFKISLVSAASTFLSGLFGLREEIRTVEHPDHYETGRKTKKKISEHHEEKKLAGEALDFSLDEPKKEPKKKKAEEPKKEPEEQVFTAADLEEVVFTPDLPIENPEKPAEEKQTAEKPTEEPKPETAPGEKLEKRAEATTKAEQKKIDSEMDGAIEKPPVEYVFPPLSLLKAAKPTSEDKRREMRETAQKLMEVLKDFGVEAKLLQVTQGPSVTRYEIQPQTGVKLSKISGLSEDIAWKLAVSTVLVSAVPGKAAIGIEVPNNSVSMVSGREIFESDTFKKAESKLSFALGKDIGGNVVVGDIAKMPHVLIAGSTGSGKSVCINTIITSILYKAKPEEVKLIMVDPKVVELGVYNGIPHLLIPVVTDPKRAAGALNWAVSEMMKRYALFADSHTRNLDGYNKIQKKNGDPTLPKIVIIIDELADLMMVAAKEVEDAICRLAQLARAAGIHLIVATQRPSVDVITGLIKANVPSRIAFAVSSQVDSRTILDKGGAEKLLGKGDMLYHPSGMNAPLRVQGAFISDGEIEKVIEFVKEHSEETHYSEDLADHIERMSTGENGVTDDKDEENDGDALLPEAISLAVELGQISTAMIQRRLKVGYARAGRIIDQMEQRGIISGANGSKPREVYANRISVDDLPD